MVKTKSNPKQASKANKIRLNEDKSITDSETEVQVVKKKKEEEITEILAIIFNIENDKHPFFSLDQVPSSIDIKKIVEPIDRSEFLKGARIKLIHEVDNNHSMVDATIQSSKIFKVPKNKTGKIIKESKSPSFQSLERTFNSINEKIFKLNNNILKLIEENVEIKDPLKEILNRNYHSTTQMSNIKEIGQTSSDSITPDFFVEPGKNNAITNYI